ncbi:hypothetical protein [Geovibrio sp. ADMFC3]
MIFQVISTVRGLNDFHRKVYRRKAHSSTLKSVVFCLRPHKFAFSSLEELAGSGEKKTLKACEKAEELGLI